jgi:hypothetical protein
MRGNSTLLRFLLIQAAISGDAVNIFQLMRGRRNGEITLVYARQQMSRTEVDTILSQ